MKLLAFVLAFVTLACSGQAFAQTRPRPEIADHLASGQWRVIDRGRSLVDSTVTVVGTNGRLDSTTGEYRFSPVPFGYWGPKPRLCNGDKCVDSVSQLPALDQLLAQRRGGAAAACSRQCVETCKPTKSLNRPGGERCRISCTCS
jgi:hypothetical protein